MTQFFCSRVERGATVCAAQCTECAQRGSTDTPFVEQPKPVQADAPAQPAPEQQQGPAVRAQIVITLYEDGNANVTGPFDDSVLFAGMLYIAQRVEQQVYIKRVREQQRLATQPKENWAKQLFRKVAGPKH